MIVYDQLNHQKKTESVVLIIINEYINIYFNILIYSLNYFINFWIISSENSLYNFQ